MEVVIRSRFAHRSGHPLWRPPPQDTPDRKTTTLPGPVPWRSLHSNQLAAPVIPGGGWRLPVTVIDHMPAVEERLLAEMCDAARGPRRNGLFALWLFVRQCGGDLPPAALSARASAARLTRMERRLSSLTLPAPLRRALPASTRELRSPHAGRVAVALQQLAAPARESIGASAGEAMLHAARCSRRALRSATDPEEHR